MRYGVALLAIAALLCAGLQAYADNPTITSPHEGDAAGPSVTVEGTAPGAMDVNVWTAVVNADTGAELKKVPGLKHAVGEGNAFSVRVAIPRVYFGEKVTLRYVIHVDSYAGTENVGQAEVSLVPQPQPEVGAMQFPPGAGEAPIVTEPAPGAKIGPNVDVVGRAQPGALVVIWTEVYNVDTNELLRRVPGIRHLPNDDGSFHFRVAAPRIFIGEAAPLRYEIHVKAATGKDTYTPDTIVAVDRE